MWIANIAAEKAVMMIFSTTLLAEGRLAQVGFHA